MRWSVAGLSVLVAVGCGRFGFESTEAADAGIDADPTVFASPMLLTELGDGADPALSADQLLIFFVSERAGGMGENDLYFAERDSVDAAWRAPQNATELNTPGTDTTPHLSPDGLVIIFASERAPATSLTLFTATRDDRSAPFGVPTVLAPNLDSGAGEFSPTLTADLETLYFVSDNFDGDGAKMWRSLAEPGGTWSAATEVTEFTAPAASAPALFDGGNAMVVFLGNGTERTLAIYTRPSSSDPFALNRILGELDDTGTEVGSWVSEDGNTLVFDSRDAGANSLLLTTR